MLWGDIAKKLEGPKPNWNLIWPAWLKLTRKVSVNPLAAKGELRKVSILCWVQRAELCQGGEKKAQSLIPNPVVLGCSDPRAGSWWQGAEWSPWIHWPEETVSDLLCQWDTHTQVPGHKWDAPEGAGERAGQAYFTHFSAAIVNGKSSCWLKISKCDALLWEGLERRIQGAPSLSETWG